MERFNTIHNVFERLKLPYRRDLEIFVVSESINSIYLALALNSYVFVPFLRNAISFFLDKICKYKDNQSDDRL